MFTPIKSVNIKRDDIQSVNFNSNIMKSVLDLIFMTIKGVNIKCDKIDFFFYCFSVI